MADPVPPPPAICCELGRGKTPPGVGTLRLEADAGLLPNDDGILGPGGANKELDEDMTTGGGGDINEEADEDEEVDKEEPERKKGGRVHNS